MQSLDQQILHLQTLTLVRWEILFLNERFTDTKMSNFLPHTQENP